MLQHTSERGVSTAPFSILWEDSPENLKKLPLLESGPPCCRMRCTSPASLPDSLSESASWLSWLCWPWCLGIGGRGRSGALCALGDVMKEAAIMVGVALCARGGSPVRPYRRWPRGVPAGALPGVLAAPKDELKDTEPTDVPPGDESAAPPLWGLAPQGLDMQGCHCLGKKKKFLGMISK